MAEEEDEGGGIPEWVVTFGDMMSLLLTFFIMLVSMSEIKEEERYQAMVESLKKQFGYEKTIDAFIPGSGKPRNSHLEKLATMGRAMRKNIMKGGDKVKAPTGDNSRVTVIRPGTLTAIGTAILFPAGGAELTEQAKQKLDEHLAQLAGKPQRIEIQGHTARGPKPPGFASSWDLAYARCRATEQYLVGKGIEPNRIQMLVAGEHVPIDSIDLERNSRVEVYLLDDVVRRESDP
ncbi:MAG: flagellar motor protein MotB [Pirellulaceae bacterium]